MDVSHLLFFCLDPLNNPMYESIRVFSPEGNLLHTIGRNGRKPEMSSQPSGVAITPNGRLFCMSWNGNFGLHIFY